MAKVTYEVVQKPIEERLIDAACIFWDVDRSYFFQKTKSNDVTYRKGVVYFLIKQNTTYSYEFMAQKFGFLSHQPVLRLVDNLDAQKEKIKHISNDINQIQHLADKLDANFIQSEMKLINNKLEITNS